MKGAKNMTTKTTGILGAAAVGAMVLGGGLALASKGSPNASAPPEVQNMGCLVGEWKGTGQLQMGDTRAELKLSLSCRWQSGGMGVACQARFTGPPALGTLEESDLFGYDANTHKYHWFAVTSTGETHDHVAEIPTGPVINWVFNGTQDAKPYKEIVRMEFSADSKQLTFESDVLVGGVKQMAFTGVLKK
jgi:hypothetical protein